MALIDSMRETPATLLAEGENGLGGSMLESRFSYDAFVAATDADRQRLAEDLAEELTRRVQASADAAQAAYACVDDLRSIGHDLWSFDESDDFQLWGGDYTAPSRAFELRLEITHRDAEARSVSVSFQHVEHSRPQRRAE